MRPTVPGARLTKSAGDLHPEPHTNRSQSSHGINRNTVNLYSYIYRGVYIRPIIYQDHRHCKEQGLEKRFIGKIKEIRLTIAFRLW